MITIPTLNELKTDIIADLELEYSMTIPLFGKSWIRTLAYVQAGKLWLTYKYMGLVQKNILPDTADSESNGGTLERFGRIKLGRNPFPATQGIYTLQLTGTSGTVIPVSTTFKSDSNSLNAFYLFILDNQFTLNGTDIITVRALTSGLESQLAVGNTLTITSPIGGLDSTATVLTESTVPQSREPLEDYRAKIIESYRLEAQGGAGADYRLWSFEAQGVKQTYPFASSGLVNVVDLFIEATTADSTDGKGTPTNTIMSAVEESIEDPTALRPSRKPLTIDVSYQAITPLDVDIDITGFTGSTSEKILINSAIEEYLSNVRPFVSSIDVLSEKNDIFDTNKLIFVITSTVVGVVFTGVKLIVNGNILTTFTFLNGDIPYLNSVNYV